MRDRHHEEWTDLLSAYLDGDLDDDVRERVERHLGGCTRCREVLGDLRAVVSRARRAGELRPPRDLWPGIAEALRSSGPLSNEGSEAEAGVIELPTASRRPVALALSPARLAVAVAGLVLVTVGVTWAVVSTTVPAVEAPVAEAVPTDPLGDPLQSAATVGAEIPADLAAQLGMLERVLATERPTLDSATVVVLERNLRTIETAIADSRRALATDPDNAFLTEHLERMYRRKLVYLQEAVRVAEWES